MSGRGANLRLNGGSGVAAAAVEPPAPSAADVAARILNAVSICFTAIISNLPRILRAAKLVGANTVLLRELVGNHPFLSTDAGIHVLHMNAWRLLYAHLPASHQILLKDRKVYRLNPGRLPSAEYKKMLVGMLKDILNIKLPADLDEAEQDREIRRRLREETTFNGQYDVIKTMRDALLGSMRARMM
jgi:hypothetical protein